VKTFKLNSVILSCANDLEIPPFSIDIEIVEEDTWQLMAADNAAAELDEHPIRLMTSLIDQQPMTPGDVIEKGNQWRTVIFNLDEDPPCRPEWVKTALERIVELVMQHGINSFSMPLPALQHHCLSPRSATRLLLDNLKTVPADKPLNVWLRTPQTALKQVMQELEQQISP
jgi:hypothetical protein